MILGRDMWIGFNLVLGSAGSNEVQRQNYILINFTFSGIYAEHINAWSYKANLQSTLFIFS